MQPHLDTDKLLTWMRWIPLVAIVILVGLGLHFRGLLNANFFLEQMNSHPSYSALILLALYLVKSISMSLPVVLLYISSGLFFSPAEAIGLNLLGLWIASSLPFYAGRCYGAGLAEKLCLRYPRSISFLRMDAKKGPLLAFLLRICGVVPMEMGSIILGACYPFYWPFILASILGLLPKMLAYTFLGSTMYTPAAPGFAISLTASVLVTVISAFVFRKYVRDTQPQRA
ncbi:MAG: TVP38/TMEM64 family protein [Syntrophomonadaceae bacterium]|nr:TVP38/TMEM64 family protein [Syntrophomonadaceae bacterium]